MKLMKKYEWTERKKLFFHFWDGKLHNLLGAWDLARRYYEHGFTLQPWPTPTEMNKHFEEAYAQMNTLISVSAFTPIPTKKRI